MKSIHRLLFTVLTFTLGLQAITAQESIAQKWIEANLNSVRNDFARPPQTARSLWHTSIAIYDAWAVYDSIALPYFLGNGMGEYECSFDGVPVPADVEAAQEMAISYAAYQVIKTRYDYNPTLDATTANLNDLMTELGLDPSFTSTDYASGDPRALGNYIASELLAAAAMDGSNEGSGDFNGYQNLVYEAVNDSLPIQFPEYVGNPTIDSLNRYQPLSFLLFCDQTVGTFNDYVPPFIGAEWGHVVPFSLKDEDKTILTREGVDWPVYHDPGPPPRIDDDNSAESQLHQWNMQLVLNWSKHLSADDPTVWDISPASIGNIPLEDLPTSFYDHDQFYDFENGGDPSTGHSLNPATGLPYVPQMVKRADYARILAEFWADGPDSETPPGHWFRIYNEIKEHPNYSWQWMGEGAALSRLEHDVKTYFTLGGTMHDAAIAAWSVKGYYDFVRPVSSLRAMAELGQISDPLLPNYDPTGKGLPLVPGWIELIEPGDTLAGEDDMYLNELKVLCWLGPLDEDTCIAGDAPIYNTETAGVGWKLALDWWPYQRPTFITPAFAGYVSGHSCYSRAAAECMTLITGDNFFPGGMAEFYAPQDDFLVFEDGPSTDVTLQWATYQDAADQCSLSRIWGGIHPPFDDIPGRLMGYEVGHDAFEYANTFLLGGVPFVTDMQVSDETLTDADVPSPWSIDLEFSMAMDTLTTPNILFTPAIDAELNLISADWTSDSTITMSYAVLDNGVRIESVAIEVKDTPSRYGLAQEAYMYVGTLLWDTENPTIDDVQVSINLIGGTEIGTGTFLVTSNFSEGMNQGVSPTINFPIEDPSQVLLPNNPLSGWLSSNSYEYSFDVLDNLLILDDVDISIEGFQDELGNPGEASLYPDLFDIAVVTGLVEDQLSGKLVFYPNPVYSGNMLHVRSESILGKTSVTIFDALGKIVLEEDLGSIDQVTFNISTQDLEAGSYLLQLQNETELMSIQILILDQ